MYRNYVDLLRHILAECDYIVSVITPESTERNFMDDETLKRAIVRSLEIIGNIIPDIRTQISTVIDTVESGV